MKFKFRGIRYLITFSWKFPFIKVKRIFTSIKPSGTVSMILGSSNGIHPVYSKEYKRTIK
jgi:hypothetical protein